MARSHSTDRSSIALRPTLVALLGLALLSACSGQSCSCDGFEERDFPDQHLDETVPRSGQVRVTKKGLNFFEKEVPNLLDQFLDGGLSFCVPETQTSQGPADIKVCMTNTCQSGQTGCQMDLALEQTEIVPKPTKDRIDLKVRIGKLNEVIPLDITLGLTSECKVDLHKDGAGNDVPATIPATVPVKVRINRQSPTNDLSIRLGQLDAKLEKLAFDIDSRGGFGSDIGCESVDLIKPAVRGILLDRVKEQLNNTVQQAVRARLCRSCGPNVADACPNQSSCKKLEEETRICDWDNRDTCVPRSFGVEGRLKIGSLLSDFLERDSAPVDLMARAADLGDVEKKGLSLGLRTGFRSPALAPCVPADGSRRPSLSGISESPSILTNTHPDTDDPFMLGVGIHERALEHLAWSIWAGGGLCLKVGAGDGLPGEASNFLTTDGLSLLIPGIKKLANRPGPIFIRTSPQKPPRIELGDNDIQKNGDTYELADPLVRLNWNDLDVHFHAFVQDRYTRIFTIRTDVRIPFGTTTDGNQLIPVVGDLEDAAQNLRIRNNRILSDDPEDLQNLIPSLLSTALSQVGSLSEPVDLPTFAGYELALDKEDVTSVDNGSMIGLYADLASTGNMTTQSAPLPPRPVVEETTVDLGSIRGDGLPASAVRLDVSSASPFSSRAPDVEYSYRVDGGFWSMYTSRETLVVDDPLLSLPGEHRIDVRARRAGRPGTTSTPRSTTIRIDYRPPELDLHARDRAIAIRADDAVDDSDQLEYRHRLLADGEPIGDWSGWTHATSLDRRELLADVEADLPLTLAVQARDRSNHVTEATETIERPLEPRRSANRNDRSTDDRATSTSGGSTCNATGGGGSPVDWLPALFVLLSAGAWRRRRGRSGDSNVLRVCCGLLGLLAIGLLAGCNDFASNRQPCGGSCEVNEICKSGSCVPRGCSSNGDCPDGAYCVDNTCRSRSCKSKADCPCGGGETGACVDGTCSCDTFCDGGCGDGEYCCYAKKSCKSYPDPCKDEECGPGLEPTVDNQGTPDRSACTVSGATCTCAPGDDVALEWYGSHASIDAANGVTAVSAYNRQWGDLMVGTLDDDLDPTWYFPDGVPEDGEVVANPEGPRGGTEDFGPDVGTHTAIAVDAGGRLHVFYRSVESGALKYARGTREGDDYQFQTLEVDTRGETGYYTSATVRDGVVHAAYGVRSIEKSSGTRTQLRHVGFPVDTSIGNLDPSPEVVYGSGPANPCGTTCSGDEVCFAASGTCATPDDDCTRSGGDTGMADAGSSGTVECESGRTCRNGACREVYEPPSTPGHRLMTGLYTEVLPYSNGLYVVFYDRIQKRVGWATRRGGSWRDTQFLEEPSGPYAAGAVRNGGLHLAYMDPDDRVLRYRASDGSTETIVDGIRSGGGEHLRSSIGQNVDLDVRSGTLTATFQDATRHVLQTARRTGGGSWQVTAVAEPDSDGTYTGAHGFYSGMAGGVIVDFVIDQQAEPVEAHLEFHALP